MQRGLCQAKSLKGNVSLNAKVSLILILDANTGLTSNVDQATLTQQFSLTAISD